LVVEERPQRQYLASFDPELSVSSGQTFLWEKVGDSWYGVHGRRIVRFSRTADGGFEFASSRGDGCDDDGGSRRIEQDLFRLDDDIGSIIKEITQRDRLVGSLAARYSGLRLMRQDPEQCLFSFVCASNTNIPMIRRMLGVLVRKYGDAVRIKDGGSGRTLHTFPSAAAIYKAGLAGLRSCGLGYRARALHEAAGAVATGALDLNRLKMASYDEAKRELLQLYGIGPKIADCVMLFSLDKLEAFPIDVWIARALAANYPQLALDALFAKNNNKLTLRQYEEVSKRAREYFGRYAGYAQQFLYYHMRQGKKW
jgi:N-glycosylase/DNA lyase